MGINREMRFNERRKGTKALLGGQLSSRNANRMFRPIVEEAFVYTGPTPSRMPFYQTFYHGTTRKNLDSILTNGFREYTCFTICMELAKGFAQRGARWDNPPIVFRIPATMFDLDQMLPDLNMIDDPCGPICRGRRNHVIKEEWEYSDQTAKDSLRIVECIVHPGGLIPEKSHVFYF